MAKKALILGASKNLGCGIAEQLAKAGWEVTGTVRQSAGTQLHELIAAHPDYRIKIEHLDTTKDEDIAALHTKLANEKFDLILYNAGIARREFIKDMTSETFFNIMMTNTFAPLRNIENLDDLLAEGGTIAVTSSGVGSLALNTSPGAGTYKSSKSALNQLMKTYSNNHPERTVILIDPGWVRTDLDPAGSNANAPLSVEESTTGIVKMLAAHAGEAGIQFRNHIDEIVPW